MKTILLNTLIAALFVVSCKTDKQNNTNTTQEQRNTTTPMDPNKESLKSKLDAKKEASKLKTDPTTKEVFKEGIESVMESGVLENALKVRRCSSEFQTQKCTGRNR